jgi:hypothetical protein
MFHHVSRCEVWARVDLGAVSLTRRAALADADVEQLVG